MNRRMDQWILLAIISALLTVILLLGGYVYYSLNSRILQGFDRQLLALSTVVSAFISGDQHDALLEPYVMDALAYDDAGQIYTAVRADGQVHTIETFRGGADPMPFDFDTHVVAATWAGEYLYALNDDGDVLALDRATGEVLMEHPGGDHGWRAITTIEDGLLLAGPGGLARLDPLDSTPELVSTGPADIESLARHGDLVLALVQRSPAQQVITIDPRTGRTSPWLPIESEWGDGGSAADIPDLVSLAADGETVWALSDQELVWLAGVTANGESQDAAESPIPWSRISALKAITSWFAKGFRSENDPIYRTYVDPMIEIRDRANITFLFTYILLGGAAGGTDIAYVIDSTTDENHATMGYPDVVSAEEGADLARVYRTGETKLSDVRVYEGWGLLKNASAAILREDGSVAGLVGVDINTDIIEEKTRIALLLVLLFGSVALLVATAISVVLARRITRPLSQLRLAALRVAAGNFDTDLNIDDPPELKQLGGTFVTMSSYVQNKIRQLNLRRGREEAGKTASALLTRLLERRTPTGVTVHYEPDERLTFGGSAWHESRGVVWLAQERGEPLDVAHRIATLRRVLERRLALGADPGEAIGTSDSMIDWMLVDLQAGTISHPGQAPEPLPADWRLSSDRGDFVVAIEPGRGGP